MLSSRARFAFVSVGGVRVLVDCLVESGLVGERMTKPLFSNTLFGERGEEFERCCLDEKVIGWGSGGEETTDWAEEEDIRTDEGREATGDGFGEIVTTFFFRSPSPSPKGLILD